MATGSATWFDAIAAVAGTIDGIATSVFAAGTTDLSAVAGVMQGVQPMTDEELLDAPAAVLAYGGADITPGDGWQDQIHEVELQIWVDRQPIELAFAQAIGFIEKVTNAFPARAKAFGLHEHLQYVLITRFQPIVPRNWPEGSERQFLVLPISLQCRVAVPIRHQPQ